MGHETALLLWAFLALQLKHFLCDFVLQNRDPMFAWERPFGAPTLAWSFTIF